MSSMEEDTLSLESNRCTLLRHMKLNLLKPMLDCREDRVALKKMVRSLHGNTQHQDHTALGSIGQLTIECWHLKS